jgi:hypothetical protein
MFRVVKKWVADRLAIGSMPDYMQELLAKKELKIGVALILNQITHDDMRRNVDTSSCVRRCECCNCRILACRF